MRHAYDPCVVGILCSKKGSSLLAIVVGAALLSLLVQATSGFVRNSMKAMLAVEAQNAKEDVRRTLRVVLACTSMQEELDNECKKGKGTFLSVKDKNGGVFLTGSESGDKLGEVRIRAKCNGKSAYIFQVKQRNLDWQPLYSGFDPCQGPSSNSPPTIVGKKSSGKSGA